MVKTEDKLLLYGVGGLVVYALFKGSIFRPISAVTDVLTEEFERATSPFSTPEGLHSAILRAGFTFDYNAGVTYIHAKDMSTTWAVRDGDLERSEYIKRRLALAIYTPGSDSWVFS